MSSDTVLTRDTVLYRDKLIKSSSSVTIFLVTGCENMYWIFRIHVFQAGIWNHFRYTFLKYPSDQVCSRNFALLIFFIGRTSTTVLSWNHCPAWETRKSIILYTVFHFMPFKSILKSKSIKQYTQFLVQIHFAHTIQII